MFKKYFLLCFSFWFVALLASSYRFSLPEQTSTHLSDNAVQSIPNLNASNFAQIFSKKLSPEIICLFSFSEAPKVELLLAFQITSNWSYHKLTFALTKPKHFHLIV
ncbi:MAG: hypothetical protein ACOYL6_18645 [Bacteriovoracaceae bacterium]